MSTIIGHAISSIPLALGFSDKKSCRKILFCSIIFSVLPDIDGIGYIIGIKYNTLFGHGGFSHSLFFVILLAIIFTFLVLPHVKFFAKQFIFFNFFLIGSLHILLDSMTNGGLGVALFSPFSNTRYFFPWRPIEVSAISSQYFFQLNGIAVIRFELINLILPSVILSLIILISKYAIKIKDSVD